VFFRGAGPFARPDAKEEQMTVMSAWDVFEDLRAAQDEMLRLTRGRFSFPGQRNETDTSTPVWAPALEVSETKDAYHIALELPGVPVSDLEIMFQDGLLTVQGERHSTHDAAGEKIHRTERSYGAFRRSITLPSHVQADKIEASSTDGVLQILVPKAKEIQAKHIQVRATKGQSVLPSGKATKNGS
jgi:HSP20 family protein